MSRCSTYSRHDEWQLTRRAFTLIELLVAIVILLVLVGITVSVVNVSLDGERLRDGSRELQSYLMGARDRALHRKMARGVRFELDPNSDPGRPVVRSVVYIGASADWRQGSVTVRRNPNNNGLPELLRGEFTEWYALKLRGSLVNGARIKLGNRWYTVSTVLLTGVNNEWLVISPPLVDPQPQDELDPAFPNHPIVTRINEGDYRLELRPRVLPNSQVKQLPSGIVIDLVYSRLPSNNWLAASDKYRDVMFSPRGTVTGSAAVAGVIHFLLNEQADVTRNLAPWLPENEGGKRVISLFTRTGNVTTSELFPGETALGVDVNLNGTIDAANHDIFYYAERGEVSE